MPFGLLLGPSGQRFSVPGYILGPPWMHFNLQKRIGAPMVRQGAPKRRAHEIKPSSWTPFRSRVWWRFAFFKGSWNRCVCGWVWDRFLIDGCFSFVLSWSVCLWIKNRKNPCWLARAGSLGRQSLEHPLFYGNCNLVLKRLLPWNCHTMFLDGNAFFMAKMTFLWQQWLFYG